MDSQQQQASHLSNFVTDPYVRSSWIAFFTLWVLWGLSYFIRHAFPRDNHVRATTTTAAAHDDPEANVAATGTTSKKPRWDGVHSSLRDRFTRAHEVLLENSLLLLSVLTLNTFGAGSTRAVMILSWIFFAFTVVKAFTEIGVDHHIIRLVFNIVFFGVTLAIGGLAFSHGWHTIGSIF